MTSRDERHGPGAAGWFRDKVAVITGGTSGIGEQVARQMLQRGARVTVCSDDARSLQSAAERFGPNDRLALEACDVRSTREVSEFARLVERREGRVDVLVNNAGFAVYRAFEESSLDELLDIVDVNLAGAVRCTKAFLPGMIARRSGTILNVSSVAGYLPITPNATYCAAKHGLVGLTRAISYELARFNVSVGVLCPDHVVTGFQNHPTFRRRDRYRTRPERLTVEAVADAALAAIEHRRLVSFVPARSGWVVWALGLVPAVSDKLLERLMSRRVEQLYAEMARETATANCGRREEE